MWTYWDGKIMEEASDGTYHLFASRWPESAGFGDWPNAVAVHAVSNATLMGSYIPDARPPFTMDGGKGQNVTGCDSQRRELRHSHVRTRLRKCRHHVREHVPRPRSRDRGPTRDHQLQRQRLQHGYEIWENQSLWQNATATS
jgi:hypothetical protein